MSTVLVVEDEARIASFVSKGLRAAGLSVEVTGSGSQAVARACQEGIDLILLDVGLPDVDGFEVLERIRGQGVSTPVIMLTARSSVEDRVAGLSGGADDYVAKPFAFEELLARVRLRMRSQGREPGGGSATRLTHRDLVLDLRTRRILADGSWRDLSAREFALAETFMRNAGMVLSREQLLGAVWGIDFDPGSNVVDVYVSYLRSKIGRERLETVRGMGYRLV